MNNYTIDCPNCGTSINIDEKYTSVKCPYCETTIYATAAHIFERSDLAGGDTLNVKIKEIRKRIMEGKNHTQEFKDLLLEASDDAFIKDEVQDYIESEIWCTKIKNTVLVEHVSENKKFIVPHFVTWISDGTFKKAPNIESLYMTSNVEYIAPNLFANDVKVKIYTDSLNCVAGKFAACKKLPLEVINKKYTPKVFSGSYGELYKLMQEIAHVRDKEIRKIEQNYKYIYDTAKRKEENDKYSLFTINFNYINQNKSYDIKRFNRKFILTLDSCFNKYGKISDMCFWNKPAEELQKDIAILASVSESSALKEVSLELTYERFKRFMKKPPQIEDFQIKDELEHTKIFYDML